VTGTVYFILSIHLIVAAYFYYRNQDCTQEKTSEKWDWFLWSLLYVLQCSVVGMYIFYYYSLWHLLKNFENLISEEPNEIKLMSVEELVYKDAPLNFLVEDSMVMS